MNPLQKQLWDELGQIPGMLEGESVFSSGPAHWVNGKQVAHFIDDERLELRLTKPVIRELRANLKDDPRVELRSSSSDWVIVRVASEADIEFVVGLARRAAEAHLPADGAAPKPPPTGADLERRRRFH
jgi:hypothetical protein